MDTRVALDIVRSAVPPMAPKTAVIVALPATSAVARPSSPAALLTDALGRDVEPHVTSLVRSCVDASLKVPVAVNC